MADWKRCRECSVEQLQAEYKDSFSHLQLSTEVIDGFGRGDILGSAVKNLEGRCSVYAIVGATALRMGAQGLKDTPPPPIAKKKCDGRSEWNSDDNDEGARGSASVEVSGSGRGGRSTKTFIKKSPRGSHSYRSSSSANISNRRHSSLADGKVQDYAFTATSTS